MRAEKTITARVKAYVRTAKQAAGASLAISAKLDALSRENKRMGRRITKLELSLKIRDEKLFRTLDQTKLSAVAMTGPHEAVANIFTNQKIYVDTRDVQLAPQLMLDGRWERGVTSIFCRNLTKDDSVVFDVGANFGYYGLVAAHQCKRGSIFFFEPNPDLVRCIRRSIAVNVLRKRAKIVAAAVGAVKGQVQLTIPGDYLGSSSVQLTEQHLVGQVTADEIRYLSVEMVTLDSYVAEQKLSRVDVVKIDVEGLEPEVYAGMQSIIRENREMFLLLEFSPKRYAEPERFFKQIRSDFSHVYVCSGSELVPIRGLSDIDSIFEANDLAMIACSNRALV